MPPVIIAAIAYIAGAITVQQLIIVAIVYVVGKFQASRAKRKATAAFNASLKDRFAMVSTVDGYRSRVYGRVRNVDGVLFKGTHGDKLQYYTLVVALAGHECDGIEQVYFNDVPVELDGAGWVLTAPWSGVTVASGGRLISGQGSFALSGGDGSITLPNAPIHDSVIVMVGTDSQVPSSSIVIVGNTVTVSGAFGHTGPADIYYQYNVGASAATAKARVRKYLGAPGQDLSTALASLFPGLIVAGQHRFEGVACLIVDLEYDQDAYPTGVPSVTAVVRGAKVLDPRTSVTAWTENPALIARDWALYAQGGGAEADELVEPSFITAANACDVSHAFESVGPSGTVTTTRPMYTCGIVCRTEADPSDTLSAIVESMAGRWAWTGGQLRIKAGAYTAPVATLTESWCGGQGDIEIVANVARTELVNVYTATIADAAQAYNPVPMPRLAATAYIEADGGELPQDLQLEAVTDNDHAQHILGVMLRDGRQGMSGSIPCNLSAYPLEVFDTIALYLPRFGFDGKVVEVLGWQFSQAGGVVLSWKETDASIFDPDAEFTRDDPAPNTALPGPFNVPPVELLAPLSGTAQLLRQADGTVVSRILVKWTAVEDEAVRNGGAIEVRYGRANTDQDLWQTITAPGSDSQVYIDAVQDGAIYIIRARARNKLVAGDWSVQRAHFVLGKSEAPAAIVGLALAVVPGALKGTRDPSTELDYAYTIYRYGLSFSGGTPVPGTSDRSGFTWPSPPAGSYTIWAADVDTTGNVGPAVSQAITVTTSALFPTSSTLSIKRNVADFAETLNYNECWIHGYNSAGVAADVPGSIVVNGVVATVPNGLLYGGPGPAASFIGWDTSGTLFNISGGPSGYPFCAVRRYQGQWQYDNNGSFTDFTPTADVYLIGTVESGATDAGFPGTPPGIVAATMWSNATTLDAMTATADAAYAAASAAQSMATTAAGNASSALSTLATMRSNGYLDAAEKPALIKEYQALTDEDDGIVARANGYGIVTERDAYVTALSALSTYLAGLSPSWSDTTTDTPITPATDVAKWTLVYSTRQAVLNKIAEEAGKVAAWTGVGGRPASYRVGAYGLSATGMPLGSDLLDADTNSGLMGGGAMYRVVKIHRTTKAVTDLGVFNPLSGALGALGECNAMATALNSIGNDSVCVVFTFDEPATNRMLGNLPAAMYRNGASRAVWGSSAFRFRGAYILVGIGGCGEGNGAENYAGAVDSDVNAWCDTGFQITALGSLIVSGASRGATTLVDYGYTGDLNATNGAPAGTYVGGTLAENVAANAANALANAATAQATADGKINTFHQDTAPSGQGESEGDLWFDTNDGNKQYIYVTGSWVVAADTRIGSAISAAAGAQATADGKIVTFFASSAPTATAVGDLWFNTTDGRLKRWSGSSWATQSVVGSGDIGTGELADEAASDVQVGVAASTTVPTAAYVCAVNLGGAGVHEITFTARIDVDSFTSAGKLGAWWSFSGAGSSYGDGYPRYEIRSVGQTLMISQSLTIEATGAGPWQVSVLLDALSGTWSSTVSNSVLRVTWVKK